MVCPTSVIFNWAAELARFRPGLRVCVYHGAARALDAAADVTLTSYALLRLDAAALSAVAWQAVVLDEAQAIKNPDSQTARAAYALPASFRLALTGTPVENRLDELWSLMHFANRGLLGGRSEFAERHARPIAEGQPGAAAALRQRVRPFLLRRLKQDVAPELPPRTDAVLRVELGDGERAVYDAVRAATQKDLLALLDEGKGVMQALEALLRLRQAACHPSLVPGQKAETSSKVEALIEALETAAAEGHKALVFSQWTSLLDLIEPALARAELPFARLDGSTRDRGARGDALPGGRRAARDAGLAEGRRQRAEPDRGRSRLPVRSLVEPGGRSAGRRSHPPHRAGAAGLRLPAGGDQHGRGADPGAAGQQARA